MKSRVEKIVAGLPFQNWRYVDRENNPVEKATRGSSARELSNCSFI